MSTKKTLVSSIVTSYYNFAILILSFFFHSYSLYGATGGKLTFYILAHYFEGYRQNQHNMIIEFIRRKLQTQLALDQAASATLALAEEMNNHKLGVGGGRKRYGNLATTSKKTKANTTNVNSVSLENITR
jgi:hypothetical protein